MLKTLSRAVHLASRVSCQNLAVRPALRSCRTFSGFVWTHGANGLVSGLRPRLLTLSRALPTLSCGCGALHTEGDKAFADFLLDEIKEEKKIQKNQSLPKMSGGWDLELNGSEAKLSRTLSGENVTVTFNVNNSVPPQLEEEPDSSQTPKENEPDIISTPNFVVEVIKQGSQNALVFDCHFPEDETSHSEGEEESDIFTIREVSFQPPGEAEWKETSYTLNTDSLDWALYDHLMDFLADRGVDNAFADELTELSTALEHQQYIRFLEDLSTFVKCK